MDKWCKKGVLLLVVVQVCSLSYWLQAQNSLDKDSISSMFYHAFELDSIYRDYEGADSIYAIIHSHFTADADLKAQFPWQAEAMLYLQRAYAHEEMYDSKGSIHFAKKSLEVCLDHSEEGEMPEFEFMADIHYLLSNAYLLQGLVHKSMLEARKSLQYEESRSGLGLNLFRDYLKMYRLYLRLGEIDSADLYFQKSEIFARTLGEKQANYALRRLYSTSLLQAPLAKEEFVEKYHSFMHYQKRHKLRQGLKTDHRENLIRALYFEKLQERDSLRIHLENCQIPRMDVQNTEIIPLNLMYFETLLQEGKHRDVLEYCNAYLDELNEKRTLADWIMEENKEIAYQYLQTKIKAVTRALEEDDIDIGKSEILSMIDDYIHCLYTNYVVSREGEDMIDMIESQYNVIHPVIDLLSVYQLKHSESSSDRDLWEYGMKLKSISYKVQLNIRKLINHLALPDSVITSEARIEKKIQNLRNNHTLTLEAKEKEELKLKEQLNTYLEKLKSNSPNYYAYRYGGSSDDWEYSLRYGRENKSQILNIHIGDKYICTQHLYGDKLSFHLSKKTDDFEKNIVRLLAISGSGHGLFGSTDEYFSTAREYEEMAMELYANILGDIPIEEGVPLAVFTSPDLKGLHLGQLCKSNAAKSEHRRFDQLNYLARHCPIIYLQTITEEKVREYKGEKEVLFVVPEYKELQRVNTVRTDFMREIFGETMREISGEKATSELFFNLYPQSRYVHFSGHSYSHSQEPGQSSLVFGDADNTDVLRASEIINTESNAALIFLSSCESLGTGSHSSEGIMGLARSFNIAGVKNVLASRWRVKDMSTKHLSVHFYEQVSGENSIVNSLFHAVQNYLSDMDPIYTHPYYWAGFQLYGNGVIDSSPARSFSRYTIYLLLLGSGMALFLLLKRLY